MEQKEQVFLAALAGLLHDIGKFALRAGAEGEEETLNLLSFHLSNQAAAEVSNRFVDLAARLIEGESQSANLHGVFSSLSAILAGVSLSEEEKEDRKKGSYHRFTALNPFDEQSIFPVKQKPAFDDLKSLWNAFRKEVEDWKEQVGQDWQKQDIRSFVFTLSSLCYKYLWCVPADLPFSKIEQVDNVDVSLYDHARLISGLAACLAYDQKHQRINGQEEAILLVRGDFSGIQDFIYRISRPEATTENIAKRLRGRSFYLQILSEVIVDWILRRFDLPHTCVVFVGGGRFDLLLPLSAAGDLAKVRYELDEWMLDRFRGELALLLATKPATAADLADTGQLAARLNEDLEKQKLSKWRSLITKPHFFQSFGNLWHRCPVCNLTPVQNENQICPDCRQHIDLGKHLPYVEWIAFCYTKPEWESEKVLDFSTPFGVWVCLIRQGDSIQDYTRKNPNSLLWAINRTQHYIQKGMASAFRFLANQAPMALQDLRMEDFSIDKGDVLTFEAIAATGLGDKRLGVLVADVDQLGLIMSEGLRKGSETPSLLRVAALSRMLDLFFAGYLNKICQQVSNENSTEQKIASELFYILYAGGDDLFIVGPWYEVLLLAKRIDEEFHAYCADNPDMSISAGYVQVKPRYPVQKFAALTKDAEKRAKDEGRNRIHLFNQSVAWRGENSLDWLLAQVQEWLKAMDNNEMNRGMIYDLGELYRVHLTSKGQLKPLWTPRLYYTLARRLSKEALHRYKDSLLQVIASGKVLVPVSITSLLMRERRK